MESEMALDNTVVLLYYSYMIKYQFKTKIGGKCVFLPIFAVSEQDARDKLRAKSIVKGFKIRQFKLMALDNKNAS